MGSHLGFLSREFVFEERTNGQMEAGLERWDAEVRRTLTNINGSRNWMWVVFLGWRVKSAWCPSGCGEGGMNGREGADRLLSWGWGAL